MPRRAFAGSVRSPLCGRQQKERTMLKFKEGWDQERQKYNKAYGPYEAYLKCFDGVSLEKALLESAGCFEDKWAKKFISDIEDVSKNVWIEQGTHQPEESKDSKKGFKLHFTGRDADGFAFHFYVSQEGNGDLRISQISYMVKGNLVNCVRKG
jgi:hypothetical protein